MCNCGSQGTLCCVSSDAHLGAVVLVEAGGGWVPLAPLTTLLSGGQALRSQTAATVAAGANAELASEAGSELLCECASAACAEAPGHASCAAEVFVAAGANYRFLQVLLTVRE
jgi:hypothetical protein